MKTRIHARGSALVLALIIVLVLSVIGVAVVRLGASETAGATSGAQRAALSQCAAAAQRLILSKFQLIGLHPASIAPVNVTLGGQGGTTWARGGHIDGYTDAGWGVSIGQVSLLSSLSGGPPTVRDETNTLALTGKGGDPMKVIVHCQEGGDGNPTSGRQLEIEYGIRFGF